jgi:hypothetical protein
MSLSEAAPHESWQTYTERLTRARAELSTLDKASARIANARSLTFLVAVLSGGGTVFEKLPSWGWWAAAGFLVGFVLLARWHERVFRAERRARLMVELNQRGLARQAGQWRLFPGKGDRFADASHLYTPDLDVFGQGSLFQLLDETATRGGEEKLAGWLSSPASRQDATLRQGAVRELAPLVDFRNELGVEGRLAMKDKADASRFLAWAQGGPHLSKVRWARAFGFALPPVTLALFLSWRYDLLATPLFWAGLALQAAVVGLTFKPLGAFYELVSAGEGGFIRFAQVFAALESQKFTHPRLVALRAGLETGSVPVSQRFASFARLLSFAELKQSAQMHAIINVLFLWDLFWFFRLEAWRHENGPKVRGWFEALYEVDALGSLAGYRHDHPAHAFPELVDGGPRFEARALGHPLLDNPITNDVSLPGPSSALVVTGSNMSGKTTLLRAMGLNAVMAQAGLPVCAQAMTSSELAVVTSMRVKDSLERGVSYFYAEVQRMKKVLDAAAAAKGRALFLVDELLLGTNTRERQVASREVVRLFLATGACGAVTTHDLSLTELAGQPGANVRNVHFQDQLTDGKMSFDYRLREGVVEGTNALRVLELAGIAIRDDERPKG